MLIGPKYKICKRLGAGVFEKCQTQKFQLAEARAPRRRGRGRTSDFGLQLLEKQKARFTYGLSEKQFARYAYDAIQQKGKDSTEGLLSRLESRLDNVVYRAGFVKTRRAARQLVSHGHVQVNGRRINIPSFAVSEGDTVSIRPESQGSDLFVGRAEAVLEHKTPEWLKMDATGMSASVVSKPTLSQTEVAFNTATIIQFYSR